MRSKLRIAWNTFALSPTRRLGAFARPGGDPIQGPDGEEYWTTKQAAEAMEVSPSTISTWRTNGYLKPADGSPPRRPLYRRADVVKAEKAAYDAAVRTSGSAKRTSRAALAG
ncbi:MerR family transcriptional regulator [Actinomadura sp. 3N508]|uniref:MerR family transcriptional regulator n=1 Tax=Actinomadura sp. 3N508 TaxID=3375153 RepID=UPI00378A6E29